MHILHSLLSLARLGCEDFYKFNEELLKDPSAINLDGYGTGWLFEMEGDASATMTVEAYYQFLSDTWEKTQRTLKGHM